MESENDVRSTRNLRGLGETLRRETLGGLLLLMATLMALVWSNVSWHSYDQLRRLAIGPLDLHGWAADGLLTIFFFLAGLELKKELTVGSLAHPMKALVPIVSSVCGMAVPAGLFLLINLISANGAAEGWAIPMATDIAFALAILAISGPALPSAVRAFLLTVAIVDDLGAIIVIAVAFTDHIQLWWLVGAGLAAGLWWLLQRREITTWWPHLLLGLGCWWCTLQSGIHATIAGVALGLLTRSKGSNPPTDHWEHFWRPVSAAIAVPLFALFSAGVVISPQVILELLSDPLPLGIMIGLLLGKTVGVFGGAFGTARFTRAELAPGLLWREVFSIAILSGVGFTVALLISDLAFAGAPGQADLAKAAVLIGSTLAAAVAVLCLSSANAHRRRTAVQDASPVSTGKA